MIRNTRDKPQAAMHIKSRGALALGIFTATVTAAILFDDVRQGGPLTLNHLLSAAVLVIALASGHMSWPYIKRGQFIGLAFGVIFLGATGYLVVSSGARNAEVAVSKIEAATKSNSDRARIEADLAATKKRLTPAQADWQAECASGKGKRCDGKRTVVEALETQVRVLGLRLEGMKPAQDTNAGYRHAAKVFVALIGGGNADAIAERLALVMPFALVLVIELSTIAFMGAGLGHQMRTAAPEVAKEAAPALPTSPVAPKPRKRNGRPQKDAKVVAFVDEFQKRHGRTPSFPEMRAQFPELLKTTAQGYRHAA